MIDISTEKGISQSYVALPESGSGPGVIVLHAWWGLTDLFKQLCDRLAAEGFVAAAPDLYGGPTTNTVEEAEQLVNSADDAAIEGRVRDTIAFLRSHPAVRGEGLGVIGFSFGAAWALNASTFAPDDVRAVAIFYGTWGADWRASRAPYLGHFASNDPFEPEESVRSLEASLRSAGRDVTFYTYPDTAHWFFEQNRPEYNAEAAELAWQRTIAFLREQLQQSSTS